MIGIDNLQKVLKIVAHVGDVADKIGHETGLQRWGHLTELLEDVVSIPGIKFSELKGEIADLDAGEKEQLLQDLKLELDLIDDNLEAVIEEGVAILVEVEQLVQRSIKLSKSLRK